MAYADPEFQAVTRRIVTRCSGSWKYQDAFGVVQYRSARTQEGRLVWKREYDVVKKASWPQLKRGGYANIPKGGLHNRPVTL